MAGPRPDLAHLGLTGTASLAEELDSARTGRTQHAVQIALCTVKLLTECCICTAAKTMVQLRDGRKIIGIMRSFDQFANIVLEQAVERIIVNQRYADVPLGLYVIRGENVVLLGQIVSRRTENAGRHEESRLASYLFNAPCPCTHTPRAIALSTRCCLCCVGHA